MQILTKPSKSGHLQIASNFNLTRRCPLFRGLTVQKLKHMYQFEPEV